MVELDRCPMSLVFGNGQQTSAESAIKDALSRGPKDVVELVQCLGIPPAQAERALQQLLGARIVKQVRRLGGVSPVYRLT